MLGSSHMSGKWHSQDSNPCSLAEPELLTIVLCQATLQLANVNTGIFRDRHSLCCELDTWPKVVFCNFKSFFLVSTSKTVQSSLLQLPQTAISIFSNTKSSFFLFIKITYPHCRRFGKFKWYKEESLITKEKINVICQESISFLQLFLIPMTH